MKNLSGDSWAGPWAGSRVAHGPAHDFETLNLSMDEGKYIEVSK